MNLFLGHLNQRQTNDEGSSEWVGGWEGEEIQLLKQKCNVLLLKQYDKNLQKINNAF